MCAMCNVETKLKTACVTSLPRCYVGQDAGAAMTQLLAAPIVLAVPEREDLLSRVASAQFALTTREEQLRDAEAALEQANVNISQATAMCEDAAHALRDAAIRTEQVEQELAETKRLTFFPFDRAPVCV